MSRPPTRWKRKKCKRFINFLKFFFRLQYQERENGLREIVNIEGRSLEKA